MATQRADRYVHANETSVALTTLYSARRTSPDRGTDG